MAITSSKFVKKNLQLPVCLITDEGSLSWLEETHSKKEIERCFDYIVTTNDTMKPNSRRHYDSPWTEFNAQFNNSNKHKIYQYSPFEQTLLLDIDYIVKTDVLLKYFDNEHGVCMFDNALTLRNTLPDMLERFLFDAGIRMWWSTVVYFDRSEFSELFFNTWTHVAENYDYYQYLYNFPRKLFRTDYCVSIAVHILSGMQTEQNNVGNFDGTPLINMSQKDDIIEVQSDNEWIMLAHDQKEVWKNILVKVNNQDIHIMNKRAYSRVIPKLEELLT
jgi:hypothetical protein